MESLTKDVALLRKKGRISGKRNGASIASLLGQVKACRAALAAQSADTVGAGSGSSTTATLANFKRAVADGKYVTKAKTEHKSLHVALAKVGKKLDKVFSAGVGSFMKPPVETERQAVISAICDHLYRHGKFDVADAILRRQHGMWAPDSPAMNKAPFQHMVKMLTDFRRGDYSAALRWAAHNARSLRLVGSSLEFELHKLRFLQILKAEGSGRAAIAYGQAHFPRFSGTRMADIRRLMGAVLYAGRLDSSPYTDLASPEQACRVENMLVADNCILHRLPPESALELSVRAGFSSLPVLTKLKTVMQATGSDFDSEASLPVEIDVPKNMHYHTAFACPVSRELVVGPANVPMLLQCGHVIGKEALDNITASRSRFKCPTCRVDQTSSNVLKLHLT